jgi:hypothetical protein
MASWVDTPRCCGGVVAGRASRAHLVLVVDLMDEEWAPISGFPDYAVSDAGRVFIFQRTIMWSSSRRAKGFTRIMGGHIMKQGPAPRYLCVKLSEDRQRENRSVHSLVLSSFVGPRPDGMQARHLNGNHLDNRLSNLVWDTPTANQRDRLTHGTDNRGDKSPLAKLTSGNVRAIRKGLKVGESCASLSRQFGVALNTVHAIKTGRTWAHLDA